MPLESLALEYIGAGWKLVGGSVLQNLLAKRAEMARRILLDRLSKGKLHLKDIPEDDAAAIIFRYMRAAEEGAARRNLRLLADVIVGQESKPGFYANDFLLWADILEALRLDELRVLGTMHREAKRANYNIEPTATFWKSCCDALEAEHKLSLQQSDLVAASLMRTGLVTIVVGLWGHAYLPTMNLEKLAEMADLETYYMQEPYVA